MSIAERLGRGSIPSIVAENARFYTPTHHAEWLGSHVSDLRGPGQYRTFQNSWRLADNDQLIEIDSVTGRDVPNPARVRELTDLADQAEAAGAPRAEIRRLEWAAHDGSRGIHGR